MLVAKFELGNVTVWPETFVAVPIPGQAVAPDGRFEVVTVQFEADELTVKPAGKNTATFATVPPLIVGVWAHTKLPVWVFGVVLLSRKVVLVRAPASILTEVKENRLDRKTIPIIRYITYFLTILILVRFEAKKQEEYL